jgi:virginiamycin B lyase
MPTEQLAKAGTTKVSGITLFLPEGREIPSSGWQSAPGTLKQVSAGSLDRVWGVNADGNVSSFRNGTWEPVPGTMSGVSVAGDGTVFGVNVDGIVSRRDGDTWTPIPVDKLSEKLAQISAVSAKEMWGVSKDGDIYQWNGKDWISIPGEFSGVSAAGDGTVWGVNSGGKVFRRDDDAWTPIPGSLSQVSVGSASKVYGVGPDGVSQWTGRGWRKMDGELANISVAADGTLWGVKSDGGVQYHVQAAPLVVSAARLSEQALEQGETAPYQFAITNTAPGTVLKNVTLTLLYDKDRFAKAEITVEQDTLTVPKPLAYGRTLTLYDVKLTASATTKPGSYGFYGVSATYEVEIVPTPSVPVANESGGWMTFDVVGVLSDAG